MASLLNMKERFFTSTEASKITGCSRRQLQHWRKQEIIVPTVNPGGKGRNVYYSEMDLRVLAVMEYLLSIGLNFETSLKILTLLKQKKIFNPVSWTTEDNHQMFAISPENNEINIYPFDLDEAIKKIQIGYTIIPFFGDCVRSKLNYGLKQFDNCNNYFSYISE